MFVISQLSSSHSPRSTSTSVVGVAFAVILFNAGVAHNAEAAANASSAYTKGNQVDENSTNSDAVTHSGLGGSAQPPTTRTPTPTPRRSQGLLFSPYKDISIHLDGKTDVMQTAITGSIIAVVGSDSLVQTRLPNLGAITLAFATGECGAENWNGITRERFAAANIQTLTNAGVNYVVSTGGQADTFTCSSRSGMRAFIRRYDSANLLGIDFDIERGQTANDIANLVKQVAWAEIAYPNLRFSFTLATLAASDGSFAGVNTTGDSVMRTIARAHLTRYTVNLMVMDFGAPSAGVCVVQGGMCEMGQSAIQAVTNLRHTYGTPLNRIELTPMIGANDVSAESFTIADVDTIASYAVSNGLAGLHFWSLDRDTPCDNPTASPICNSVPSARPLQYAEQFLLDLGR